MALRPHMVIEPSFRETMPARILQIDLSAPLQPIPVPKRYGALWIVVRWGIRPIGWLRWPCRKMGNLLQPDLLQVLLADQLGLQIIDLLRDPSLRQPPANFTPSMSVVICTREHPEQLRRQLQSCSKLRWRHIRCCTTRRHHAMPRSATEPRRPAISTQRSR
jgi:hypothetical protein